ncbi:MAG: insulinase family protein, partial [Caulobacteraceae bacterium]|nr:insulinase family protein [Caulobacter sp.]
MSLALAAGAQAQVASPLGPPKRDGVWGQSYSDLKPEADVRFGQLPNGLRYAVKRNRTPGGQASLRLRIGAGSLEEHDDQQGLAHFLEHMAFKGSAHVPEGEMIKILQRKGLAFGPDTNAFTSFDQTVYELDLPETDADTLDTGLFLLRETASELTLSQSAMDSERGVILSEERLRDSPAYQSQKAELGFLLAGQRVPQRWPIGQVDIIKTAPVSRIRQFYEANYRPDDATVIAVGDFDPDEMVRKITARFGDWKAKAPAPPAVDLGHVETRGEAAEVFAKPGAPQEVQLTYAAPYDDIADTFAREQRDTVEQLALAVLNRRLDRISRQPNAPFIEAQAARANVVESAKLMSVSVDTTPDGWAKGLAAAVQEVRRAVQFGVTAPELQREIAEMRTQLANKAAGADTRKTPSIASEIVQVVNDDEVLTGPVQNAALFDRYVKAATLPAVNAALRAAFVGSGPLLTLSSSQAVPGGEAALRQAYDSAAAKPVTADAAVAAKPWPYGGQAFGAPGRVVEQRAVADLGLVQARFANGVRLTVKRTPFATDEIYVAVRLGDGRLGLPRDRVSPLWAAAALTAGGTEELTADEIEQTLADKVVSSRFTATDDAWQFTGKTRPVNLAV